MLDFNDYRDDFGKLHPTYSEEQLKEIFELTVDFRQGIIENLDLFINTNALGNQ